MHIITRMVKGGAQEDVLDLVVRVDNKQFISTLVTGPSDGPEGSLDEKARRLGADICIVPSLVRDISPFKDLAALFSLVRIIRAQKPDIVHTHTSKAGIIGRIAAWIARTPVVIHSPHGHVFHGYYGKSTTFAFILLERWCARLATKLIMITENERTDHLNLQIAPESKFTVIHSGVDMSPLLDHELSRGVLRSALAIPEDATLIGTLGRLVPIKGQIHLIDAMPKILRSAPKSHLVLVGSGPLEQDLKKRAEELGIAELVHFPGYREDVGDCLRDLDIFVLPSINEGMGRALVEAMALKLPVVASSVCGIRDLVTHNVNGKLSIVGDAASIASAVIEFLSDPNDAKRMGEAAFRTVVPDYGVDTMLTQIEQLYRSEADRAKV